MNFSYHTFFESHLDALKTAGNYRRFATLEREAGKYPEALNHPCQYASHPVTIWCSNDYLGMSQHPEVIQTLANTAAEIGVGAGGTRNISGNSIYHARLERQLAGWYGKDAALIFTSAYVANHTALYTLGKKIPGLQVFSDEYNHASLIRGIVDSGVDKHVFKHNDMNDLRRILKNVDKKLPKLIVLESVYSMHATVAPLKEVVDIAQEFNALIYLDEVHAVGLYGKTGTGQAEAQGVSEKIHFINGTFGKALGVLGGFITGERHAIDFIRSFGAGFIFTTALPPCICSAVSKSMDLVSRASHIRQKQQENVKTLKAQLKSAGIPFKDEPSHIIPVLIGDAKECKRIADILLYTFNIYVQPINYPTVPWGQECLRLTPSPYHTAEHIEKLVCALQRILIHKEFEADYSHHAPAFTLAMAS